MGSKELCLKVDVETQLRNTLKNAISDDYLEEVIVGLKDEVIDDVKETSAYGDNGCWNNDDIKLALGRVLLNKIAG